MTTYMVSNGEPSNITAIQPKRRQNVADENSHLLENGMASVGYDHNRIFHGRQPRNTLRALFALTYGLVAGTGRVLGRLSWQVWNILIKVLLSNYINLLLVLVPFAVVAPEFDLWSPTVIFALNLIAVAPLATMLAFAIKQMSMSLNEAFGNLLMATSGNVVHIIIGIVALREGQIGVVKSTIVGFILLNLLLVMGSSFFLGGIFNMCDQNGEGVEQTFASATAQTTRSLMTMSLACLVIPTSLYTVLSNADFEDRAYSILHLSRGTAVILLLLYSLYLLFQLHTHPDLFSTQIPYEENTDDHPIINVYTAAFIVAVTAFLIHICAFNFAAFIDDVEETNCRLSKRLIGVVLIPAVSNVTEHLMAINMAIRNKMDLTMGVAAGSCIQASLFTTPLLVILGWAVFDRPMDLLFERIQTIALVFAVLVVYTAQDGKSNYLHGAMLIGLYSILTLAFYVPPRDPLDIGLCN